MKWAELVYLLFAIAHPVSELMTRTSLRSFLNEDYYKTHQEDFPVKKSAGVLGSLFVLFILLIPFLLLPRYRDFLGIRVGDPAVLGCWSFALGLVLADLIQHGRHVLAERQALAPRVHLITIVGVLVPQWIIARGLLAPDRLWLLIPMLAGALVIVGNWALNSWNVAKGQAVAAA